MAATIETCIAEKQFYEALQICKSTVTRRVAKNENKLAIDLISKVFDQFIQNKQEQCAVDVAKLLIEVYTKQKIAAEKENIELVYHMADSLGEGENQTAFLKAAIKWTINPENGNGDTGLHQRLGERQWKSEHFSAAQYHLTRGNNPHLFAQLIFDFSSHAPDEERDLFVARAVLQGLCAQRLDVADTLFADLTSRIYPGLGGPASESKILPSPLLNFCKLTILVCQKDESAAPLFVMLRENYEPSIARDQNCFSQLVDIIGKTYFKIEPKSGGIIADMMKGFFEDDKK